MVLAEWISECVSFFLVEINLHYKTHPHLYIYLLLKPRYFLACVGTKSELPFGVSAAEAGGT